MNEQEVSGDFKHESEIPKTLLDALGACDRDSFPNILFLLVAGCTLLISSAEAERSFSLMRRIKTYRKSVMTEDLALISMQLKERVPADEICKSYSCRPNRVQVHHLAVGELGRQGDGDPSRHGTVVYKDRTGCVYSPDMTGTPA